MFGLNESESQFATRHCAMIAAECENPASWLAPSQRLRALELKLHYERIWDAIKPDPWARVRAAFATGHTEVIG